MTMRAAILLTLTFAVLPASSPLHATEQPSSQLPTEAKAQVDDFFLFLKKNQPEEAIDNILRSSPLWSNRIGVKEQLLAQVEAGLKIYGPVKTIEMMSSESKGTMLVRQYWFAQHDNMVTRWEFDFVRTANGWQIGYFGFNDQLTTWF